MTRPTPLPLGPSAAYVVDEAERAVASAASRLRSLVASDLPCWEEEARVAWPDRSALSPAMVRRSRSKAERAVEKLRKAAAEVLALVEEARKEVDS